MKNENSLLRPCCSTGGHRVAWWLAVVDQDGCVGQLSDGPFRSRAEVVESLDRIRAGGLGRGSKFCCTQFVLVGQPEYLEPSDDPTDVSPSEIDYVADIGIALCNLDQKYIRLIEASARVVKRFDDGQLCEPVGNIAIRMLRDEITGAGKP